MRVSVCLLIQLNRANVRQMKKKHKRTTIIIL